MFNSNRKSTLLALTVLGFALSMATASAQEAEISTVNVSDLPINVANQEQVASTDAVSEKGSDTLISPTKAQVVAETEKTAAVEKANPTNDNVIVENTNVEKASAQNTEKEANFAQQKKDEQSGTSANEPEKGESFDFDLRMKAANQSAEGNSNKTIQEDNVSTPNNTVAENVQANTEAETAEKVTPETTTTVQYKVSPVEDLGNSVLSQLDDDLFSQMSAIEKSTTLLTLELRREKIRNEIEAQKAIRRKSAEDAERQKAEEKLKELERRKQIEAQVIREQQILADKEKLIEVLKQRKLINA